jgi:predicted dehydrogenase
MLKREKLDGVILATPPRDRLAMLRHILSSDVQIVLCEKPLSDDLVEARAITELVDSRDKVFAVNFFRRWHPEFRRIRTMVRRGDFGVPQAVTATYTKGIRNNALHIVDWLMHVFGPIERAQVIGAVPSTAKELDPTIHAVCWTGGAQKIPVFLIGADHRHHAIIDIDIIFSEARVRLVDIGRRIEVWRSRPDPDFAGYRTLALSDECASVELPHFEAVYSQLIAVSNREEAAPLTSLQEVLIGLEFATDLIKKLACVEPLSAAKVQAS